jgi:tRNA (cytidine56-2'-O)-methyltransferase
MDPPITILRLGHRPSRDSRVTTHVALVGRAFGADGMVLTTEDRKLAETVDKVCDQFGGRFSIEFESNRRKFINDWKRTGGKVVHLTMYGEHIDDCLEKVKALEDRILLIVGAEKVPREIYELADFNIAVGNQPHSEIAALAVFLDRLSEGKGLKNKLMGKMVIEPNARGKTVKNIE